MHVPKPSMAMPALLMTTSMEPWSFCRSAAKASMLSFLLMSSSLKARLTGPPWAFSTLALSSWSSDSSVFRAASPREASRAVR